MFCTVITPTIGRQSLASTVRSVIDQRLHGATFEMIVVNDSGAPLPSADWMSSALVRMITTWKHERSWARNTGAAIAQGDYLLFLDDDDWLLPGALQTLYELASRHPQAALLYGGVRVVADGGQILGESCSGLRGHCLAQLLGGAWIPIQTALIRNDAFFQAGGFNPHYPVSEETDLYHRISYAHQLTSTREIIGCLFRGASWNSTTPYPIAREILLRSRDETLALPGAYGRIRRSLAESSEAGYWHGRTVRVFFSAMRYHLRANNYAKAASRAFFGALSTLLAGPHTLSSDFWQGVRDHHTPDSLHFIMKAIETQAVGAAE